MEINTWTSLLRNVNDLKEKVTVLIRFRLDFNPTDIGFTLTDVIKTAKVHQKYMQYSRMYTICSYMQGL